MRDRGVGGFVFGHRSKPAAATETLLSQGKKNEEKKEFFPFSPQLDLNVS